MYAAILDGKKCENVFKIPYFEKLSIYALKSFIEIPAIRNAKIPINDTASFDRFSIYEAATSAEIGFCTLPSFAVTV